MERQPAARARQKEDADAPVDHDARHRAVQRRLDDLALAAAELALLDRASDRRLPLLGRLRGVGRIVLVLREVAAEGGGEGGRPVAGDAARGACQGRRQGALSDEWRTHRMWTEM